MQHKAELPGGLRRVPTCGWLACCACVVGGFCGLPAVAAAQSAFPTQPAASSATVHAAPSSHDSPWNVLGRSVEDRVIEYRRFGEGPAEVLVVGPLEGDETAAIDLIEQLAQHLEQFPRRTSGAKVTLVRDPNPDGRLRRSPANARGVRLDQNFPTRGWRKVPLGTSWLSGREPESEPEVRALVDLVDDLRPDRVIIVAATRRQAELIHAGPAEQLAREFAKTSGLRPASANVAAMQGSLAVYTGDDRQIPTLVVHVPAGMRRDQLWATYKRAVLAAIGTEADDEPEGNAQVPPRSFPPVAVLAATKRLPPENVDKSPSQVSTPGPRVLSADELEFGGELVPITRPPAVAGQQQNTAPRSVPSDTGKPATPAPVNAPRRQFGPTLSQAAGSLRGQARSVPHAAVRIPQRGGFPPAMLMRSGQAVNPLPSSMAPPKEVTSPGLKVVERLPAIDSASSPPRTLPQPIPLYPETGY